MPRASLAAARPLVIAHRAGNEPARARAAHTAGADLIEADVWLHRGRLEVRHTKTLGPLPLLWDRWLLAPWWTPRLRLEDLLAAIDPETGLLLDLKGRDRRLPDAVADALARSPHRGAVAACSRRWELLDALDGHDEIARMYSAGNRRELDRLLGGSAPATLAGVSVHRGLLDAETVRSLKQIAPLVVTWPVNDARTLRHLLAWGVDGVTTDEPAIVREIVAAR